MGSISSKPKAPVQTVVQRVVYAPAPAVSTPPPPSSSPPSETPDTPSDPSEARAESLLRRDRGRFGTVLTSFRGLLSPANPTGGRKTLLGE